MTTYAGFMAWRTLARERRLELFEVWQVPLSIAVGLGGALIVTSAKSASAYAAVVSLVLALAAGGYGAAFGVLQPRKARPAFSFYVALALALTLTGIATASAGASRVTLFAALAVAGTGLAFRFSQPVLALNAAAFSLASAFASGLVGVIADHLVHRRLAVADRRAGPGALRAGVSAPSFLEPARSTCGRDRCPCSHSRLACFST